MRRWAFAAALLVAVLFPIPSHADEATGSGDEAEAAATPAAEDEAAAPEQSAEGKGEASEGEDKQEAEPFFAPVLEYGSNVSTQFLTGLNGLLTWPADPVMATVEPPKALEKAGYGRRPLGFGSGVLLMLYRSFTGTLDLALAWGPLPVLSPVPRYKLVPGFEHEDE